MIDLLSAIRIHIMHDESLVWDEYKPAGVAEVRYHDYEIVNIFQNKDIWVRNDFPENHDVFTLKIADPDFFEKLDKAIMVAKSIIDKVMTEETALAKMRMH